MSDNSQSGGPAMVPQAGASTSMVSAGQSATDPTGTFLNNLFAQAAVQQYLDGNRYRVLYTQAIENLDKEAPAVSGPARWSVVIYDYTNNRALETTADFPAATNASITASNTQPLPSAEEWEEAAEIVRRDAEFSQYLLCGLLVPYRPMPAFVLEAGPSGEVQRTLTVGLMPAAASTRSNQIVAVNMVTQRVATYSNAAPDTSLAGATTCGIPAVYCPAPARGTPGQLWISWPAANPVWRFLAVRPATSSGISGSGLELRYVDYRGKRLLYQAHVPILNVKYDGDACGPYRDWQYDEHCFECDGTDLAPGFRRANTRPQTACDGSDAGNFTGVALFDTECELILTTEMEAGWYRYIQEWRFHKDGTLRPRFKFAAATSSCVCHVHNHHCYWRFDFDIRTPGNNLVQEYNNPPIFPNTNWHKKVYEIKRYRDYGRHRKWRVSNTQSGEAYDIVPGPTDGIADTYGRGDVWIVRYHGNEIDDGGSGPGTEAGIDKFVNGELVENQDLVVWYGAHFRHNVQEQGGAECHEVGPTLMPVQW